MEFRYAQVRPRVRPQIICLGASLTEWAFQEEDHGFGWYLQHVYGDKVEVVNKGKLPQAPQRNQHCMLIAFQARPGTSHTKSHTTSPSPRESHRHNANTRPSATTQTIKPAFDRLVSHITLPLAPPTQLITIFLGTNDACLQFLSRETLVHIDQYEFTLRSYVNTILDKLPKTKILLITPPPINVPDPAPKWEDEDGGKEGVGDEGGKKEAKGEGKVDHEFVPTTGKKTKYDPRNHRSFRTYVAKKFFAERMMRIVKSYEGTGRVAGVDFWKLCVEAGLKKQGRESEVDGVGKGEKFELERLPGCGLKTAKQFGKGWFTDGTHLGPKVSLRGCKGVWL
jgi:lysophospholipase L1-like esterase